jgi:Ca2+-transporting ATPase
LFNASIAVNSTALETVDPESRATVFTGSQMEAVLLRFAKSLGWANYNDARDPATIIQMIKVASEILTRKCTRHVVVYRDGANENSGSGGIETAPIGELEEGKTSHALSCSMPHRLFTRSHCVIVISNAGPPMACGVWTTER